MHKYTSKQVQILRPAERVYDTLSSFNNFTPILKDRVEGWSATESKCHFKAKGIPITLEMIGKEPHKMIKVVSSGHSPIAFTLWVQLHSLSENDTRMRLVLHVEMSMIVKMAVGGKIQGGLDEIAENLAAGFNQRD